jgi:uncharacterized protein YndB with AHSA1/START domain
LRIIEDVEDVEREIVLDAPPDEVWEALTDAERFGEWFGSEVDRDPEAGEVIRFKTGDSERRALVERVEEPSRLTFRWLDEPPSRVDITIEEIPDGSVVRVVERRIDAAVTPTPRIGFRALARA